MKNLLLIFVVMLTTGCAVNNTLTYDAVVPKEGEAIVVFGMTPSNTKILFNEAVVDNGFTRSKNILEKAVGGNPLNGYVPIVVKADVTYKLSNIILYIGDKSSGAYRACDGARTISFKANAGSVTYITDINFSANTGGFKTENKKNFAAAKRHIDENYHNLRGKIVDGNYQMVTPTEKCADDTGSSTVIVVPAKK